MERTVSNAIKSERVHRLEAELALEKLKKSTEGNIFSISEEKDFEYIWKKLDRFEEITVKLKVKENIGGKSEWRVLGEYSYLINIGSIIPFLVDSTKFEYQQSEVDQIIKEAMKPYMLQYNQNQKEQKLELINVPDFEDMFLIIGLLKRTSNPRYQKEKPIVIEYHQPFILIYTNKIERFKYWLAYNKLLPKEIVIKEKS